MIVSITVDLPAPFGPSSPVISPERMESVTFERLMEDGWVRMNLPRDWRPYADPKLATPSGKIQILAPELERLGLDPLPTYLPQAEDPETSPGRTAAFPLMLLSPPEHPFMNSTFVNIPALERAAGPQAKLLLHPNEAAVRGIEDGDRVRIFNARGSFRARGLLGEGREDRKQQRQQPREGTVFQGRR